MTAAKPKPGGAHTRTHWSLVRRLKAGGHEEAWQEFYTAYRPLIHGLALKSGLSREEAEEAVQDTVTCVFKSLPSFNADPAAGSFKSWLFRVAQWRIINQLNKRPRRTSAVAEAFRSGGDGSGTAGTAPTDKIPDSAPNALEALWDAEWQENALEIALSRLKQVAKARHFQAFYLHVIKRQSPSQVAKALGTTVEQVYLVKCRLLPVFKRIVRRLEGRLL
ncbi:MAG: sigma-70 family RNA polymerase sigma factor [Verrucomicrobiota bacterium]|jgi:RNA polymerase sigma factor (sigma-70 family)|nr:sigma-70 family RNA polymerase sigma factor [Verrucomicrobiota bacterium]OQC65332.1 MAG: ECF RNA polymerase sigma factor RpoE [Verrucomicrobia bacterium ADurb.Bin006]HOA61004.1 sigma-70 family RNA polymerase sigma factor [Verrucomicrobiota bacterium]HOF48630.1 sigma-70 family RNA polymerase sigma factor [Verrucomicrobiota bacterium]HOU88177.1 sigma-70 family RNA polymerase sigma factor [Verrucomicrobiota bacterium]